MRRIFLGTFFVGEVAEEDVELIFKNILRYIFLRKVRFEIGEQLYAGETCRAGGKLSYFASVCTLGSNISTQYRIAVLSILLNVPLAMIKVSFV